jgi:hypothetical protein
MTHYLLAVHSYNRDGLIETRDPADLQAGFEATAAFNDKIVAEGSWVFGGGLFPPAMATVVDNRSGDVLVTDGPFAEAKEYIGGFWVIDVPDLEAALKLAAEASSACNEAVEVRPFHEDTGDLNVEG